MLFGIVTIVVAYLLVKGLRTAIVSHYGNPYAFAAPRMQLVTILLNVLVFRAMIINLKKEETAKGVLFITVLLSMVWFILFLRYNFTAV